MIGLVGPNGAGKTTLMQLLVGQMLPSGGSIRVDDADLQRHGKAFRRRLGYLPQDFGLYEELTVRQFLDYMACLKGLPSPRRRGDPGVHRTDLAGREGRCPHPNPLRRPETAGGHRPGVAQRPRVADRGRTHRGSGSRGANPLSKPVLPRRRPQAGDPVHAYHRRRGVDLQPADRAAPGERSASTGRRASWSAGRRATWACSKSRAMGTRPSTAAGGSPAAWLRRRGPPAGSWGTISRRAAGRSRRPWKTPTSTAWATELPHERDPNAGK